MDRQQAVLHARKLLAECGASSDHWVRYDMLCSILDIVKKHDITVKELRFKGSERHFLRFVRETRMKVGTLLRNPSAYNSDEFRFDNTLSATHPHNVRAAELRGMYFDPNQGRYVKG